MSEVPSKLALYASVGNELDALRRRCRRRPAWTRRDAVSLPANVQLCLAARRPQPFLLRRDQRQRLAWAPRTNHHVSALRVDRDSGALSHTARHPRCRTRPIHMGPTSRASMCWLLSTIRHRSTSSHQPGRHAGAEVGQPNAIDPGIFAHQVRGEPRHKQVILVTPGHDPAGGNPRSPARSSSSTSRRCAVERAVGGAQWRHGVGPRHLDFHPTKPWVTYRWSARTGRHVPVAERQAVAEAGVPPDNLVPAGTGGRRQAGRTVHVHPSAASSMSPTRLDRGRSRWPKRSSPRREHRWPPTAIDPRDRQADLIRQSNARHPLPHLPHRSEAADCWSPAHIQGIALRDGGDAVLLRCSASATTRARLRAQYHIDVAAADDVGGWDGDAVVTSSNTPSRPHV